MSPTELAATTRPGTARARRLAARRSADGSVAAALEQLRAGGTVVLVEADEQLRAAAVVAAQFAGGDEINSLNLRARGPMYLALTAERCDALGLDAVGGSQLGQPGFTVSVGARQGLSNGISARDRARTVAVAIDPQSSPSDLVRPGHVLPVRARAGGLRERAGIAEAVVDIARLAGLVPAGVYCPVVDAAGELSGSAELAAFCHSTGARMVSIPDLIAYRRRFDRTLEPAVEARLPTPFGEFRAVGYRSAADGSEHLALIKGDVRAGQDILVSVHSRCVEGDLFGSTRCDCRARLDAALEAVQSEQAGAVIYLAGGSCHGNTGFSSADPLAVLAAGIHSPSVDAVATTREILLDLGISSARFPNGPEGILEEDLRPDDLAAGLAARSAGRRLEVV